MVYNIYTDDSLVYRFILWQMARSDHFQLNQGVHVRRRKVIGAPREGTGIGNVLIGSVKSKSQS